LEGGSTSSGHESGDREGEEAPEEEKMLHDSWGGPQVGHATCQGGFMGWLLGWAFFCALSFLYFSSFSFYPFSVLLL
jgi:hypothetical protein